MVDIELKIKLPQSLGFREKEKEIRDLIQQSKNVCISRIEQEGWTGSENWVMREPKVTYTFEFRDWKTYFKFQKQLKKILTDEKTNKSPIGRIHGKK